MQSFAEDVLGHGTPIAREIAQLVHGLGMDDAHLSPITDPRASREARIETRREWPDSPMSDVPDRYALFALMGDVDLMAWPELGTAMDSQGRIAAHLDNQGRWILIQPDTMGSVVVEDLASGGHIARVALAGFSRTSAGGFPFSGPDDYITAVRRAREHMQRLDAELLEPQDRG
jgi:hypothetical protein